jgi:hypothetical protein
LGKALAANQLTPIKVFTELPPCKSCLEWIQDVAEHISLSHYYCNHFENYYDYDDGASNDERAEKSTKRNGMWQTFFGEFCGHSATPYARPTGAKDKHTEVYNL